MGPSESLLHSQRQVVGTAAIFSRFRARRWTFAPTKTSLCNPPTALPVIRRTSWSVSSEFQIFNVCTTDFQIPTNVRTTEFHVPNKSTTEFHLQIGFRNSDQNDQNPNSDFRCGGCDLASEQLRQRIRIQFRMILSLDGYTVDRHGRLRSDNPPSFDLRPDRALILER